MPDNKLPWDNDLEENTRVLTASKADYMKSDASEPIETIAGREKVKYGLGKPIRISITGDLKHDSD